MSNRLDDGFSTLIELANLPDIKFYEKEVTPPGVTGGGPIDTTTMRNITYRTQSPKALKTLGPMSATVAFASDVLPQIEAQMNVNQLVTVTFPDGSTWTFWGWLDEFTLGAFVEGEQPTATVTIQPSNHDNEEPPVEQAPVYAENDSSVSS